MNRNKLVLIALAAATLLTIAIFAGCDPLPYEGPLNVETAPKIFWAAQQTPTQNSRNPVLSWYSTDPDGIVLDYQFVVILDSVVIRLGGPDSVTANFLSGYQWTIVHEDSSTVPLYAHSNPDSAVDQYVFLKAMDDDSLYSGIIYKLLSRTNHPPTSYLDLPMVGTVSVRAPDPQWCLPETTASWKGIRVAWVGKDSIDISGLQPDFEWQIRIYGPFPDSASCDTVGPFMFLSDSTGSPDAWIKIKEYKFKNLETGWHLMYARCRDDAFVPSIPALGYLRIFEPTWIRHPENSRKILLADHSRYYDRIPGELKNVHRDSVIQFYSQLLQSAGYDTSEYSYAAYTQGALEVEAPKSDLYNHELVIVLDTDWGNHLMSKEGDGVGQQDAYAKYLAVGGKLWIVGRRTFQKVGDLPGWKNFALGETQNPLPVKYLNMSAAYGQFPRGYQQAEFAGALGALAGFPNISVDTARVAQTSYGTNNYSQGLINVSYLTRLNDSETIYKFNSLYPDTSLFHNFPVAIRYQVPGSFKTSIFSFPLYFIKTDQAEIVTREMLDWFFEN